MTISARLEELACRGFSVNLAVVGSDVQAVNSGKTFKAEELEIGKHHRFEGISDPSDMAIVYAIESQDGTRGVLVDAFAVYANPVVGTALRRVRILNREHVDPKREPTGVEGCVCGA